MEMEQFDVTDKFQKLYLFQFITQLWVLFWQNIGVTTMERPVPKDGSQACARVSSLQKYMHTCVCIQGYCQRLVSIWIVINVCNLEINLLGQDWKIFRHYWVMHCVLQHISNDWRVWNSKQAFALRWIEQQNSLQDFCMGEHNSVFEIYQKLLLYISQFKVRAQCIACVTIQISVLKKWCKIKCLWILKLGSENGVILLATDWYASSKQTGERGLKLAPVSASISSIMRSQSFPFCLLFSSSSEQISVLTEHS